METDLGPGPAGAVPDLPNFASNYSTLCDWAGTGAMAAAADSLMFNNHGNSAKVGNLYGFPDDPHMINDHPFSFLLHGAAAVAADPWNNGLGPHEFLAVRPGPAFGFEGTWAGPGLAAPYA